MLETISGPAEPVLLAPRRKGQPAIAWAVIVLLVVFAVWRQRAHSPAANPALGQRISQLLLEFQARLLIGGAGLSGSNSPALAAQASQLNVGPPEDRWCYVIVVGELAGPTEALQKLQDIKEGFARNGTPLSSANERIEQILGRLYGDAKAGQPDAPSLSEDDRTFLRQQLRWLGRLALSGSKDSPAHQELVASARQTALVFLVAAGVWGALGLVGLFGLILLVSLWFNGMLRSGPANGPEFGGIYAETFAVWLALFFGLSLAAAYVPARESSLLVTGLVMLLSLVALAWPVLRGVPWRRLREDIGLTRGRRPWLEPFMGVSCYAMAIPLVVVGVVGYLMLLKMQTAFQPGGGPAVAPNKVPAHPVVISVVTRDWWKQLQVFFLASIVAPLVEETMFRGVLYRHLREASAALRAGLSIVFSGLVVSFVFAVIHPQGLVAVPLLMALAFAFALAREWRDTLVPCMVAHGITNGLVMLLFMLALG